MHRWFAGLVLVALALSFSAGARAETQLNPELEERARALFLELRCVVCQNQSIGDSDADVARDLREIVREQIQAGQTNQQIRTFLVDRYGEFILLKPVFAWHTLVLWVAPVFLLLLGGFMAWRVSTSAKRAVRDDSLSEDEEAALNEIIDRHTK